MKLQDLLNFVPKNKRELKKELNNKNITYTSKRKFIDVNDYFIDEFGYSTIRYIFFGKRLQGIVVALKKEDNNFNDVRDKMVNIYGVPQADNSYNNYQEQFASWNDLNILLKTMSSTKEIDIILTVKNEVKSEPKFKLSSFLMFMGASLLWGSAMYFGDADLAHFDPYVLIIWYSAGFIFGGTMVYLIPGISRLHQKRKSKPIKADVLDDNKILLFKQNEELNNYEDLGIHSTYVCIKGPEKIKIRYRARVYFKDNKFITAYIKDNVVINVIKNGSDINIEYDSPERQMMMVLTNGEDNYYEEVENLDVFRYNIDELRGFHKEEFLKIKDIVTKEFVEFDPASLIKGGLDVSEIDRDMIRISSIISKNINITADELTNDFIKNYYDLHVNNWDILANNIVNKLKVLY